MPSKRSQCQLHNSGEESISSRIGLCKQARLDEPLRYVIAHANPRYSETSGPPFRRPAYPLPSRRPTWFGYRSEFRFPVSQSCLLPVKDAFCQPQTRETGLYGDRGTCTPDARRNRAQDTESREAQGKRDVPAVRAIITDKSQSVKSPWLSLGRDPP